MWLNRGPPNVAHETPRYGFAAAAHSRSWHFAAFAALQFFGRYRTNIGHHRTLVRRGSVAIDPKQTYVPCGLEPLGSAIWGQSLASRPRGADEVLYNRDKRYRFICNAIPRL